MLLGTISQDRICPVCQHDLRLVRDADATLVWCPYCGVVSFWHEMPQAAGNDHHILIRARRQRLGGSAFPATAPIRRTVRPRSHRSITRCAAARAVFCRLHGGRHGG